MSIKDQVKITSDAQATARLGQLLKQSHATTQAANKNYSEVPLVDPMQNAAAVPERENAVEVMASFQTQNNPILNKSEYWQGQDPRSVLTRASATYQPSVTAKVRTGLGTIISIPSEVRNASNMPEADKRAVLLALVDRKLAFGARSAMMRSGLQEIACYLGQKLYPLVSAGSVVFTEQEKAAVGEYVDHYSLDASDEEKLNFDLQKKAMILLFSTNVYNPIELIAKANGISISDTLSIFVARVLASEKAVTSPEPAMNDGDEELLGYMS